MINADFVKAISGMAVDAAAPVEIKNGDKRKQTYVVGGNLQVVEVPPPERCHVVRTVEALVDAAKRWGFGANDVDSGVLWHDFDGCVLLCDDDDRRDVVSLPLPRSPELRLIDTISQRGPIPHRDFVRLLRHDLVGVVPSGLATAVSAIEVHSEQRKASVAERGRERGTAEFRRELAGAVDIPETTLATLAVYDVPDLRQELVTIDLAIDVDLEACACRLLPLPGAIRRALESTQLKIAERLAVAGLPLFWGTPK